MVKKPTPLSVLRTPETWNYGSISVVVVRGKAIRIAKQPRPHKEVILLSDVPFSDTQTGAVRTTVNKHKTIIDFDIKPNPKGDGTVIVLMFQQHLGNERLTDTVQTIRRGICSKFNNAKRIAADSQSTTQRRSSAWNSPYDNASTRAARQKAQADTRPMEHGSYVTKAGTTHSW